MKVNLWFENGTQQDIEAEHLKIICHKSFNRDKHSMTVQVDNEQTWNYVCLIDVEK